MSHEARGGWLTRSLAAAVRTTGHLGSSPRRGCPKAGDEAQKRELCDLGRLTLSGSHVMALGIGAVI